MIPFPFKLSLNVTKEWEAKIKQIINNRIYDPQVTSYYHLLFSLVLVHDMLDGSIQSHSSSPGNLQLERKYPSHSLT